MVRAIRQPLGTMRTSDFRDSDGDGIDDRDQRRPGGRNIVEKRRRKAAKQPGYRPPAGPPGYRNGDHISIPTPPSFGVGPGSGNDVIDIRGTNNPLNDKIRGGNSKPDFNLSDIMKDFNSGSGIRY